MKAILHIARTEILEHRRQPWMLFILVLNYAIWITVFGTAFVLINHAAGDPVALAAMRCELDSYGLDLDTILRTAAFSYGSMMFTNLPLFVAIMSGYSVLHDRACGTMPFLMLAPITRRQLLAGKLLGAMALPLLLHVHAVHVLLHRPAEPGNRSDAGGGDRLGVRSAAAVHARMWCRGRRDPAVRGAPDQPRRRAVLIRATASQASRPTATEPHPSAALADAARHSHPPSSSRSSSP